MGLPAASVPMWASVPAIVLFTALSASSGPANAQRTERAGKDVIDAACGACHLTGKDGAPRIGDAAAWAARTGQGLTMLTEHALKGIRKMPAHGGSSGVSDLELQRAIVYMVNNSGGRWIEPAVVRTSPLTSQAVVQQQCASCHQTGKDGAPKIGDRAAWTPRFAKGLDRLVASAVHGHGAMPARGGMPDLEREDIRDATLYMFNYGLPAVAAGGQGGLLDVALDPRFADNRIVYWSYTEPAPEGGNRTAVARGRLDGERLADVQVIFRQQPAVAGSHHFGSRLVFGRDGRLFVTLGDRFSRMADAQTLDNHLGKVVRIEPDGRVPADNPFVGRAGALPEIWSLGHRNAQGIAVQPGTGAIWTIEHGTRGGDEVNLDKPGLNYGWPDAAYGVEYAGGQINSGVTQAPGTEQPVYYWDPVIAPGGAIFYQGAMFPGWDGNLLVAGLKEKHIARLVIQNDRVVGEERLLTDLGERVRDVAVGADGAVWAITDEDDGKLVRLAATQ